MIVNRSLICTAVVGLLAGRALAQVDLESEVGALRELYSEQQVLLETQAEMLAAQQQKLDDLAGQTGALTYSSGFVLSSENADANPKFQMKIGSWGQLRHNFFDSDGPNPDQNDIELERLRLAFQGHAYSPSFQYFFQLDADTDAAEVVDMLDYYVTYDFGHELFCCDKGRLQLRFGKWKIGFNRAREESGVRMQFSDRSTASVLFDFDRAHGVGLLGELGAVDWQLAVANGIDTGGFRTTRSGLDRNLAVASRINYLLCGDWGKDGHADLEWRAAPAVRFGSGFTYSRRDIEGAAEFTFPRAVDSGVPLTSLFPPGVTAYDQFMYAADVNVKYQGWSLVYEHYVRQFSGFAGGAVPDLRDYGYWIELGYFLVPERFQLIGRHARIVGNSETLGGSDQTSDEVAGGWVYYARRHNLKLTFDVTHLDGAPINDAALSIRPGDAGWLYRTQFQWKF
jgi:hypothetical protein